MSPSDFEKILNEWSEDLSKTIKLSLSANKKVYIIALSRKMPRFFKWYLKNASSDDTNGLVRLLRDERVELTTEYAIPVIFGRNTEKLSDKVKGIIADDVILFGATVNRVSLAWMSMTGTTPDVSSVFRSDRGVLASRLENMRLLSMDRIPLKDMDDPIKMISGRIMRSSLPVDIEYPILYLDRPYNEVKDYIKNRKPDGWTIYDIKSSLIDDAEESCTILLDGGRFNGFDNDFAKVRLFKADNGCCLELIAPNTLRVDSLKDSGLFGLSDNREYIEAWSEIFKAVSVDADYTAMNWMGSSSLLASSLNESKLNTLNVWANYLLALSTFMPHFDNFIPEGARPDVDVNDLSLILGKEYADRVKPLIDSIINGKLTCKVSRPVVVLPFYVNPADKKELYLEKITSVLDPRASIEDNLDNLFGVSYYASPIFDDMSKASILSHHSFGESYESLDSHLRRIHYNVDNKVVRIHSWIDLRIDESRIAPKYEMVTGSDGEVYFRRFFLCGSLSPVKHVS